MEMEEENAAMFCDEYQTRSDRKHQKWKEAVLREDKKRREQMAKKKDGGNKEANKRRKISMGTSVKKGAPTQMYSIFDAAKKKKKKKEESKSEEVEDVENVEDEDIDLIPNVVNDDGRNCEAKLDDNEGKQGDKPLTARDRARMAALQRQEAMMRGMNPIENQSKDQPNAAKGMKDTTETDDSDPSI